MRHSYRKPPCSNLFNTPIKKILAGHLCTFSWTAILGSSAEYFAAILQDNHAATIIGESTGGAGCGYTNGGIPAKLRNTGAIVKMPDCIRFRTDGSNEVNGIIPDLLVAWPRMASDYQRAMALMPVLDKALGQLN